MSTLLVLKKSNSKQFGGDYFYSVPNSKHYTLSAIYEHLHTIGDVQLINCDEHVDLLSVLKTQDFGHREQKGNTQLLNRIIREGGFCSYIEKLEGQLNGSSTLS